MRRPVTASTTRAPDRGQATRGILADPARDLRACQTDAMAAVLSRVDGADCCRAHGQAGRHLARKGAR